MIAHDCEPERHDGRKRLQLSFQAALASEYKGATQKIRILTEHWIGSQVYCPNCGHVSITQYKNNSPVADFFLLELSGGLRTKGI